MVDARLQAWAGTLAGTIAPAGTAGNAVLQAGIQAGLQSIASQASVALISNKGDLGAVFKQLGSSAALRTLATPIVGLGNPLPVNSMGLRC